MITFDAAMSQWAQRYLVAVLAKHKGSIADAAREAGRNRTDFYKLLAKFKIEVIRQKRNYLPPEFRGAMRAFNARHVNSIKPFELWYGK